MATIQVINIGASANDNTGDPLRTAFDKQNQNNTSINNDLATKAPLANASFTTDILVNLVKIGRGGGNFNNNTCLGNGTGTSNTSGIYNTFVGQASGYFNNSGSNNSFFGQDAGQKNTSGNSNSFLGKSAGFNTTIGFQNTFLGRNAGFFNISGSNNSFLGQDAGANNVGDNNTFVGQNAGFTVISSSNCSILGCNADVAGGNEVQLGNSLTTTYVYGTVGNRSDLRDKADVKDTVLGLDFISKLRPVDYRWDMREDYKTEKPIQGELSDEDFKIEMGLWVESNRIGNLQHDGSKKRNRYHHGFIAQEVRDLGIDFGGFQDHKINGGEDVLSIGYDEFIAPMIKAIQELKAEIELLKMK